MSSLWHHSFISSFSKQRPPRRSTICPTTRKSDAVSKTQTGSKLSTGFRFVQLQDPRHRPRNVKKHKYNSSLKTDIYRAGATVIPEPRERAKRMKSLGYGSRAQFCTQLLDACDELRLGRRPVTIITITDKQHVFTLSIYRHLVFLIFLYFPNLFSYFTQVICISLCLL